MASALTIGLDDKVTGYHENGASVDFTLQQLLVLFTGFLGGGQGEGGGLVHFDTVLDKPIDLQGYGIQDAYTKAQTDLVAANAASTAVALLTAGAPEDFDNFSAAYQAFLDTQSASGALAAQLAGKLSTAQALGELATDSALQALARTHLGLGDAAVRNVADLPAGNSAPISWNALLDKPTTIGGSGIGDVYTKTESDTNAAVIATQKAADALAALTNGAPDALNSFVEVFNRFVADESTAAALTTSLGGKLTTTNYLNEYVGDPTKQASVRSNIGLGNIATHDTSEFAPASAGLPTTGAVNGKFLSYVGGVPAWVAAPSGSGGGQTTAIANNMTSGTAPSGNIATSKDFYAGFPAWQAFDGSASTIWSSNGTGFPAWLQRQFPSAAVVTGYTLRCRSDQNTYSPSAWTLYGTNDGGTTLVQIDAQTAQNFAAAEAKTFTLAGPVSYTGYRIVFTNGKSASYLDLAEFLLVGTFTATVQLPPGGALGQTLVKQSASDNDAVWVSLSDPRRQFRLGTDFAAFSNGNTGAAGGFSYYQLECFSVVLYGVAGYGQRQAAVVVPAGPPSRAANALGFCVAYTGAVSGNSFAFTLGHSQFVTGSGRFRFESGMMLPAPGTVAMAIAGECQPQTANTAGASGLFKPTADSSVLTQFGWRLAPGTAATRTLQFYQHGTVIDTGVVPVANYFYHMAFEVAADGKSWTVEWTDNSGVFHTQTAAFDVAVGTVFCPVLGAQAGQATSVGMNVDYFYVTYEPTGGRV